MIETIPLVRDWSLQHRHYAPDFPMTREKKSWLYVNKYAYSELRAFLTSDLPPRAFMREYVKAYSKQIEVVYFQRYRKKPIESYFILTRSPPQGLPPYIGLIECYRL